MLLLQKGINTNNKFILLALCIFLQFEFVITYKNESA